MRQPREIKKGAKYHVYGQFNRKEPMFIPNNIKELFLQVIGEAHRKYNFRLECFVLMDTHYHIIIEPQDEESLSRIMQWILGVFAQRYNRRYGYVGHVWRDRFKSEIIRDQRQYNNTIKYIIHNPVNANMVESPSDWQYSSYSYMIRKKWIELKRILGCPQLKFEELILLYSGIFARTFSGSP